MYSLLDSRKMNLFFFQCSTLVCSDLPYILCPFYLSTGDGNTSNFNGVMLVSTMDKINA
jgi:hypothetical protein